ncbi:MULTISPECIES: flavin reductase family protein [Streptomyces]|uniref:flavin reductase family protein n=1 Tax=Streptomyces TaxID=1883 RepID=UPI0009394596|nr:MULTISPECIES: flavin reductase family protein [unclassified Streptomyces]OKJ06518.1 flavin reductase [Streptomyces sp. TSRI0261]QNQ35816.1 flavin reductase family protein [Streptomyces sp. CB00271]
MNTTDTTGTTAESTTAPRRSGAAALLRRTLRGHASGVTVITVPGPAGFTASSFTSVSLEPALVSFCLDAEISAAPAVLRAEHFAVHLLGAHHTDLARTFARWSPDRFAAPGWTAHRLGPPLFPSAAGWLVAGITLRQRIGDHWLIVGELADAAPPAASSPDHHDAPATTPLIHHNGSFASAAPLPQE